MDLSNSKIKKHLRFQEIELSSSNIRKVLLFVASYFSHISGNVIFLARKIKTTCSEKMSCITGYGTF